MNQKIPHPLVRATFGLALEPGEVAGPLRLGDAWLVLVCCTDTPGSSRSAWGSAGTAG